MNPTLLSIVVAGAIGVSLFDDFETKRKLRESLNSHQTIAPPPPETIEYVQDYEPEPEPLPQVQPTPQPEEQVQPKTFEHRKARLIQVLAEYNLTPVWELRNATPLRFTGWQRSGKSTKAQVIALLRQIDNLQHPVTVCTPHFCTPGDKTWSSSFKVVGSGNQWGQIKGEIDRLMGRLAKGDTNPYTTILDEFSAYAGNVGKDSYIQELMLSAVREMAKHNEMLMLIAHGDTMAINGNVKGLSDAMRGNFVTVGCNRKLIDGRAHPDSRVTIDGGGFPSRTLDWPDWLTPEWLLANFPELETIAPVTAESVPSLGAVAEIQKNSEIQEAFSNGDPCHKAIVEWFQRRGTAGTPRQIQLTKLKALVDAGSNRIEAIQMVLDTLVYDGILAVVGVDTYALVGVVEATNQRVNEPHSTPRQPTPQPTPHPEVS